MQEDHTMTYKNHARQLLASLLLCCASAALAQTPAAPDSLDMAGQLALLIADVGMMHYEPDNGAHVAGVKARMQRLSPLMDRYLAAQPSAERQRLTPEWRAMRTLLLGDDTQAGLVDGYDSYLHATYSAHRDILRDAIFRDARQQAQGVPEQATLQMARILSGYMLVAASPFGSFAMSSEDEDADLSRLSQDMDTLWQQLLADAPAQSPLREAQTKWLFIRSSVLHATEQSLPYIVSRNARQILLTLARHAQIAL
jgi:hypothetical protein